MLCNEDYKVKDYGNGYMAKTMDYFTYNQFMNELEELKKDYYIIGYHVDTQKERAVVKLFKKEKTEHE